MKYRVVICSYKRSDVIQDKTLKFLRNEGIPNKKIDIFVANVDEKEHYERVLPTDMYDNIIIGKLGYNNVKNEIMKYYPEGMKLVHLDDDVEGIKVLMGKKLVDFNRLQDLIKNSFSLLKREKCKLMGLAPVQNAFYMKNDISKGLYFCIGNFYFAINDKNLKLNYADFTDYENSLKNYLKYGAVLRYNNICSVTKYDTGSGGTNEYRSEKLQRKIVSDMLKKYPKYVQLNPKKKNKYQIKFKRQKGNTKLKLC